MMRAPAFACLLLLSLAPAAAAAPSAADRGWINTCSDQLKAEKASEKIRRRYCSCMHDYVDDNAAVSQREMERLFPPAHRRCRTQAGWK